MSEARRPWEQAFEVAVRQGMITADQAGRLARVVTGATEIDAASLAASAGIPSAVVDSLLRLATAMAARPGPPLSQAATDAEGIAALAGDVAIDMAASAPGDDALQPSHGELTLSTTGPSPHKWHFTAPASVLIGRSQRAHVRIEDLHASGVHAVIEITGLGCRIRDIHSANHTYVNGKPIEACDLVDGDEILVGRAHLRVSLRSTPPSTMWMKAPSLDLEIPGYAIETLLGKGAQGHVYLAKDLGGGGRPVALKTLQLPYILDDKECGGRVKRFLREAMVGHAFRHPNVVEVYGANVTGRTIYIVMEYVAGRDLGAFLKRHDPLPFPVACRFVLQALDAMAAAHARKLVHRDLKPENLLLTRASPDADIKVGDLGLAKNFALAGLSGFTESGTCAGTLEYMGPEQLIDFKYVGPHSDVFSLGAVLFRLLAGRGVYQTRSGGPDDLVRVLEAVIPPLASVKPDVPPPIAAVVDRALRREPSQRFEDAARMREALQAAVG